MERDKLVGLTTPRGWKLLNAREPSGRHTGGCHSWGYVAANDDGDFAFVKALDMRLGLEKDGDLQAALKAHSTRVDQFRYEWDLAERCTSARLSGVVQALEEGYFEVEGEQNPVPFLVFELAEGDLREQSDLERRFDLAFRLQVLHKTAVGLAQLHGIRIALQDMKPSNIIVFRDHVTKIADLGNAHHREITRPGVDEQIAADKYYAPPEQLYGAVRSGWETRRLAADLYLLGSIAVFLTTGVGMTQSLKTQLRDEHWWTNFGDEYEQVVPYLREAMDAVLEEVRAESEEEIAAEMVELIGYLCDPDPDERGHPKNIAGAGGRCGLERFVSRFDRMASYAEYRLRRASSR